MNQKAIDLVKQFEGCKLTAYKDIVGVWTIGYGCTGPDIKAGVTWTKEQAEKSLSDKLEEIEGWLAHIALSVPQNNNQIAALTSLVYNIGQHAFYNSTLREKINDYDPHPENEFMKWAHAGGQTVIGLIRRRMAEKALYVSV